MKNNGIKYIVLIVGIILVITSSIFKNKSEKSLDDNNKNMNEFQSNANTGYSYSYIDFIGTKYNQGFILSFKNDNPFVVYIGDSDYKKVKDYKFDGETIKLVGNSVPINNVVKAKILEKYNEGFTYGQEDYLKEEDFELAFGSYYLDVEEIIDEKSFNSTYKFLYHLFIILGFVSIISYFIFNIIEKKNNNEYY